MELFAQERRGLEVSSREVRDTEPGGLRGSSSKTGEPEAAIGRTVQHLVWHGWDVVLATLPCRK
jgi:hypothetical protein